MFLSNNKIENQTPGFEIFSWNGANERELRLYRKSVMKATTFGLLHLIWWASPLWLVSKFSVGLGDWLFTLAYLVIVDILSNTMSQEIKILIIAVAYWIAGVTFTKGYFIIPSNIVLLYLQYHSDFSFVILGISISLMCLSRPTIYDINPCSIFFGLTMAVCVIFCLTAFSISSIPQGIMPFVFFPHDSFPDQFSNVSSFQIVNLTTSLFIAVLLNVIMTQTK